LCFLTLRINFTKGLRVPMVIGVISMGSYM